MSRPATDVTALVEARKRAEADAAALRRSEEQLRLMIEATSAGTWELETPPLNLIADAAMRQMHGFPVDGPIDIDAVFAMVHVDDVVKTRAIVDAALDPKGDRRCHAEYRIVDGAAQRWIEARGGLLPDASGEHFCLVGTALDTTPRKESELARQGLLEALAAQPFLQVCVLEGPRHVVTLANPECRANVAGGRDLVGTPVLDAFSELADAGFDRLMSSVLATGEPYIGREVATRFVRAGGAIKERYSNCVVQPVRGPSGAFDTLLNISQDVTEVVAARARLERIAERDQQGAAFERQLIGIVSHDLRNPLSVVRIGVDLLLRDQGIGTASLKVVQRIHSTVDQMVRLVNDLLDFTPARIGSGLPVSRAPMNLHPVVRQVAGEVQMIFPERRIEIEAQGDGHGDWDRDRMAQVALNLITNALKYSPAEATIRVQTVALGDRVALEVLNPGPPTSPQILPHLFDPMRRGSDQVDPSGRSVGLGLYIVKHIVDAHGGTIAVTSTASEGTSFALVLPRHPAP
jgi:sigma-B regulation protein RsbU (phosphoserine phosphatase)